MAPVLIQLATDNTLRNAPPPFLASTGAKACVMRSTPKTLVSNCARATSLACGLSRPPKEIPHGNAHAGRGCRELPFRDPDVGPVAQHPFGSSDRIEDREHRHRRLWGELPNQRGRCSAC